MLLNSHISAYTRCLAEKVCGLVRFTWGTSQGEGKLVARDKILNTKVARQACAGQIFPLCLLLGHNLQSLHQIFHWYLEIASNFLCTKFRHSKFRKYYTPPAAPVS